MSTQQHKRFFGVPLLLAVSGFALAGSIALIYLLHSSEANTLIKMPDGSIILPTKSTWHVIGEHIATALAILGFWHVIDQLVIKREFKSELVSFVEEVSENASKTSAAQMQTIERHLESLEQSLLVAKHDPMLGLAETFHEVEKFSYSPMIRESQNLVAVLGDGYSWVGRHAEALTERFTDPNKTTTIILVHPESDLIPVLARKVGMQPDHFRQKIYSTLRELAKMNTSNAKLKVVGHTLINSYSVIIADSRAIYSPYFLSTQRFLPPIFIFKDTGNGSFFSKLSRDVTTLQRESSPVSEQLAFEYGDSSAQARSGHAVPKLL